jgi:hypothetical protein
MAEDSEFIHVNGHTFDVDDLTFEEHREIKTIARTEIWNEDVDGPFQDLNALDMTPAIVTVFMRRDDPSYQLAQALKLKPLDVWQEKVPPTEAKSPGAKAAGKPTARKSSQASSRANALKVAGTTT